MIIQEHIESSKNYKLLKEKRDYGLKEIERLKDKIAKLKEQHKLELLNASQVGDGPLDTTISSIDGVRGFETYRSSLGGGAQTMDDIPPALSDFFME